MFKRKSRAEGSTDSSGLPAGILYAATPSRPSGSRRPSSQPPHSGAPAAAVAASAAAATTADPAASLGAAHGSTAGTAAATHVDGNNHHHNRKFSRADAGVPGCSVNGLHGLGITRVFLQDGSFRTMKAEAFETVGELLRALLVKTPFADSAFESWSIMILSTSGGQSALPALRNQPSAFSGSDASLFFWLYLPCAHFPCIFFEPGWSPL